MSRERLANRRGSLTFDVESLGLYFTVTTSRFSDGRLAEVFIRNHKSDSAAGIMASDAAIAASLAFQFGCPVECCAARCRAMRKARRRARWAPRSINWCSHERAAKKLGHAVARCAVEQPE